MLCFRCGSPVSDTVDSCENCGQDLSGSSKPHSESFTDLQKKIKQTGRQWARPATYQIGEIICDRYEIRDVVGTGPLGLVYKAFDQEVEVDVALKVIASEFLPDQEAREQFLGAMHKTLDLVHENVVRYFDVDHDGERCFYVMQFLEGLTLRKIMNLRRDKQQCFSINEVEPIFVQLCSSLGKTSLHLIHGGVKPENIIILPDLLKVTDFGLFDAIPRAYYLSAQQAAGGAARYLAPEIRDGRDVDVSADVYSIAAILVELLTGKIRADEDLHVTPLGSDIPEAFERVLRKALSDDPLNRYNHPGELGEDLTAALTGKPVHSTLIYGATHKDHAIPNASAEGPVREDSKNVPEEDSLNLEENPTTLFKVEEEEETAGDGAEGDGLFDPSDPAAPPPEKEHSQVTHQLALDEIEFASQKIETAALLAEEGSEPAAVPAGEATERTVRGELEHPADEEHEEILTPPAGAAEDEPLPAMLPSSDQTQQIDAEMIIPMVDDDPEEEILEASGALMIPPADLALIAPAPDPREAELERQERRDEEAREASEARAREALQAFDFDAGDHMAGAGDYQSTGTADYDDVDEGAYAASGVGQYGDLIAGDQDDAGGERVDAEISSDAAGHDAENEQGGDVAMSREVPSELSEDLEEAYLEEAPAPFEDEDPPLEPRADPMAVAPEVLNLDAVPNPIDVTLAVSQPSPPPEERLKLLPAVVVAFIALVIGGTLTLIFYINKTQDTATQHQIERKQITHGDAPDPGNTPSPAEPDEPDPADVPKVETLTATNATAPAAPTADPVPDGADAAPSGSSQVKTTPLSVPIPAEKVAPPTPPKPTSSVVRAPPPAPPKRVSRPNPPPQTAKRPAPRPKVTTPAKAPPRSPAPAPATSTGEKCPKGMQLIKTRSMGYCIDRYEYPGRGRTPKHGVSLAQARAACSARGLRLCNAKEWLRSCGSLFPYGRTFKPDLCNTGATGVLKAGQKKGCRSRWGVYDLSGNVSEWVDEGVAMGGTAKAVEGHATCPARSGGGPLTGFRCCGDLGWD